MMHRAFRTTLHTSLAACAALAASATLASSEGVAIGNKNIPSIMKENEDNGTVSFDRNPKTLRNRVPDDGPAYPWYEKRAKNCCQPCINKINVEREKKICAFYESGLCTSRAATTAHENGTLPVYNELSYKVTKWFSDWREESKDAKICPSCGGRLTYPCFFAWKRFCPEIIVFSKNTRPQKNALFFCLEI